MLEICDLWCIEWVKQEYFTQGFCLNFSRFNSLRVSFNAKINIAFTYGNVVFWFDSIVAEMLQRFISNFGKSVRFSPRNSSFSASYYWDHGLIITLSSPILTLFNIQIAIWFTYIDFRNQMLTLFYHCALHYPGSNSEF